MCGKCEHWGQLILRLAIGPIFIAHGGQKLFVQGHTAVAGFLTSLGVPLPGVAAWLLMLTEFVGGILLLLGLFTRWASIPVAFAMLVAIITVHLKHGLTGDATGSGFEFPLALMAMALCLMVQGGGKLSVDHLLKKKKSTPVVTM